MPIVEADWSVTRATGNIRYIGDDHSGASPSYATVIEFHRFLQDKADDPSSIGDDEIDISDELPSARSTDNIMSLLGNYNIDNNAAEHLYDGSVSQNGGDDVWYGIVNFGATDVQVQLIQNGAVIADDWWNFGGGGLNSDAAQGVSHQFMISGRVGGADIDNRHLIGTTRVFGKTYSEFVINKLKDGVNVLALNHEDDLNNQTLEATIAAIADITNTEGYHLLDVDNDTIGEPYLSEWDRGANSINTFYEYGKYLTKDGSLSTLYGLSGELFRGPTHQVALSGGAGTWVEPESLSWGSGVTAGTGQLFAVDDTDATAGTVLYMQLLTGVPPNANTITGNGGATATAGVVTARAISKPFVGASTGSALIGPYGLGMKITGLTANDKVTDLNGTLRLPPNNVVFSVGGLVSGEDRILVAPWDGVSLDAEGNPAIDKSQFTLNTALTGAAETAVVMTAAIPSDTPNTGNIRVILDSGLNEIVPYTSWSGSTFTIPASDFSGSGAASGNNAWISYIEETASSSTASFSGIYSGSDRSLVVRVRDGGATPIKEFLSSATLGSSGGSITVIRTSDE